MSRIAILRKLRGWSRVDLAERANVTETTIVRAERHDPPPVQTRTLEKIALALDTTAGALMHEHSDPDAVPVPPRDPDVLFIQDLAPLLRTTVRRLRHTMKVTPWLLPEPLPSLDKRWRWSRVVVERWLELREQDRRHRSTAARQAIAHR